MSANSPHDHAGPYYLIRWDAGLGHTYVAGDYATEDDAKAAFRAAVAALPHNSGIQTPYTSYQVCAKKR